MINYIWTIFIILGILYGVITGNVENVNNTLINSGSNAIEIIFNLIPLMCLWLGLMSIAKDSGLIDKLAKRLNKVLKILFPEIPDDHEALTYISSNIILNMLGVGNAATPFGLKAMQEMQKINKNKDEASRSMITFIVMNTAAVTIIPTTIISLRILNKSLNPMSIVPYIIITSTLSCIIGLILDRLYYLVIRR